MSDKSVRKKAVETALKELEKLAQKAYESDSVKVEAAKAILDYDALKDIQYEALKKEREQDDNE